MRMLVVILARALMTVGGAVFVRPGVWMGMAQRAMTMQVALYEFIGRGHIPSG
jgi:hypothetical protein